MFASFLLSSNKPSLASLSCGTLFLMSQKLPNFTILVVLLFGDGLKTGTFLNRLGLEVAHPVGN